MGAASLQPSQAALLEGSWHDTEYMPTGSPSDLTIPRSLLKKAHTLRVRLLAAIRVIRPSLGFRGKLARVLREQTWDPIDDGKGQFGCA